MTLPRKNMPDFNKVYFSLLKNRYPKIDFILLAIGKATITDLENQINRYYQYTNPNLVIIHCGLVDCAPRALKKGEIPIVKLFHLRRVVNKYKIYLRKHRNISYTTAKQFETSILSIKKIFQVPIISIGIIPPLSEHEKMVPGISYRVKKFNEKLAKNSEEFIDMTDFPENGLSEDLHHLNEIGHSLLFERLCKKIDYLTKK